MSRLLTFFVGSTVEAWAEFRTHRARVIMSLIGVALAVLALTGVAAIGAIGQQAVTESLERAQGRPALLNIGAPYNPKDTTGTQTYSGDFTKLARAEFRRYDIRWSSRVLNGSATVALPEGATDANVEAVDPDWGTMHRVKLTSGSWFSDRDTRRLAPAVVVDTGMWKRLGEPDLATHPTLRIGKQSPVSAVIIGVTPGGAPEYPGIVMLADDYSRISSPDQSYGPPQIEAWVPPRGAAELSARLASDLSRQIGDGWTVDVSRNDYAAYQTDDPLLLQKIVVGGAAGLILLLGALGLINISMVTVQSRVREIGIRRSFGATAGRVFFGVMMESVVATVAAGVVGVALAILALKNPWVTDWLRDQAGLQDVPAFPASAAVFGLIVAAGVGAIAGLLPALVAVRVKPIDAIRY